MKIDLKQMSRYIAYHSKILFKGFVQTLCGALLTVLIAAGSYRMFVIPTEGGYIAVLDFLLSTSTIYAGFAGMHIMGRPVKRGAKK